MREHVHQTINKLDHCVHCGKPMSELAAPTGSVNVPKELYGWLVEYALELRGAWHWKLNSTRSNCETMTKLDNDIKQAVALKDSPNDALSGVERKP